MKRILMGVAASAMLIATSCSNEEIVKEVANQNFTLSVSVGGESRTFNSEDGKCLWGANEQIYVTSEDGKVFGTLDMVSISDDKKTAQFSGVINGHPSNLKYSVYPVPNNNGEIKVSVKGGNHNAPMYGEINGGNSQFQYAGGLVKLTLRGAQGAKVNIPTGEVNAVGGSYKFDLQTGTMKYYPDNTPVGIESIPADGVVYLPVATTAIVNGSEQTIDQIDLDVYVGKSNTTVQITGVAIENGKISTNDVPNIEVDENGNVNKGVVVTTADGLATALADKTKNIKLGASITATEIITISSDVVLDGNGKTLTSSAGRAINIETTDTVTINNLNIVAEERAINIINKASTVNLNDVTATADNNAVMIATTAGAVKLTVENCNFTGLAVVNIAGAGTTADIIDTKITNVDTNDGENYGAITLWTSAAGASVIVSGGVITVADDSRKAYVFPGDASVTGVDDIGYIVATIGIAGYETLNEAVEDVTEAGTIELMRDINVSEPVLVEKDFTINMNGKTLSLEQPISVSGTLNLSNGTISSEGEVIVLENDGQVNIDENVKLKSGNGKGRIKNQDGLGTISASNLGNFIVFHEIEKGTFESFMSLNEDQAYKNINTLVLKDTFTVANTVIEEKFSAYEVDPSSYFSSTGNEFGGHVKRIEFTEGSSLDVRNNVGDTTGRTSIGFEDICILGDASIIGNEDNESVIYFDRGTKITISEGKTLSLKNKLRLATGNNPVDSEKGNAQVTGTGTLKIVGENVLINDKQNDPNAIILNVLNVVVEKDTN